MKSELYRAKNESYLTPLFWVHGESKEVIRNSINEMQENGIGSFTVEPRPHVNYLKEQWWGDLEFIIDEAKKRDMKVWIFDDGDYPSGCANGEIIKKYPQYRKKFLRVEAIDALGPMKDSSFYVEHWLEEGEVLVAAVAGKLAGDTDKLVDETLIDVSHQIKNGILYWDIPEGHWQVFIMIRSLNCLEDHTKNHINLLEKEAVKAFINMTYEPTYDHLKEHFGETLQGFFTDEPRFGNFPSYTAQLGIREMPLPYSDDLIDRLSEAFGSEYIQYLPLLWREGGAVTSKVRYTYMDTVSYMFKENYSDQIGDWCRERNVKLIGHVIEENGAHARVGYGLGHFFRSLSGFDYSGLDIVYNIMPGYTSGTYTSPIFKVDVDFNHWGIAKMASSAGHIDPKKNGITICEAFGAYGWQEGLKLMKWITDHLCVRGVNVIVPHAFTLREFPDPDCPPHFYAGGHNPQWKDFNVWSSYANRVCHLMTGGIHRASAAVLYHGEAEWAGDYEPFERTVKALALKHIDCDIVPIDSLMDEEISSVDHKKLRVNEEDYSVLIVPYAEYLPAYFEEKIKAYIEAGLPVVFIKGIPKNNKFINNVEDGAIKICDYDELGPWMIENHYNDILVLEKCEDLRHYHYSKDGREIYYFVNESKNQAIDTTIQFNEVSHGLVYDALTDQQYKAKMSEEGIHLQLDPYESAFVIFGETIESDLVEKYDIDNYSEVLDLGNTWEMSVSTAETYPTFEAIDNTALVNITRYDIMPEFSGMIRYRRTFDLLEDTNADMVIDLGSVFETANVWVNGHKIGSLICPPYRMPINKDVLREKDNEIVVEVTNTLVKKHNNNEFDKYMPQEPSGLFGPVSIYKKGEKE